MRFPLEGIRTARVEHLALSDVGGWGFRTGLSWTAIMLRCSECLILELESGRKFMVSVDDAPEAAALVNGLLKRTEAA